MIERSEIHEIVRGYRPEDIKIGVVASHSALDTCDGAVEEGFGTVAFCQRGRERTYADYFRSKRDGRGRILRGMVDDPQEPHP